MKNFNKSALLICGGLLFCFFGACHSPQITLESPQINEVAADSKFVIILPEDHTKGYSWMLKDDFDKTALSHDNTVWHGNEKGVYFHFRTFQRGQDTLLFVCRKYRDTLDIKRFIVKISAP